jgi:hypothetical protein
MVAELLAGFGRRKVSLKQRIRIATDRGRKWQDINNKSPLDDAAEGGNPSVSFTCQGKLGMEISVVGLGWSETKCDIAVYGVTPFKAVHRNQGFTSRRENE